MYLGLINIADFIQTESIQNINMISGSVGHEKPLR